LVPELRRILLDEAPVAVEHRAPVLVAPDGRLANPRELTLFKADTLLVVLPTAPGYAPTTTGGTTWYAPAVGPALPAGPTAGTVPGSSSPA